MPCRTCGKDCKCLRMMSKRGCGCRPCDSDCTCSCNTSSSNRTMPNGKGTKDGCSQQSVTADGGVGCCCSNNSSEAHSAYAIHGFHQFSFVIKQRHLVALIFSVRCPLAGCAPMMRTLYKIALAGALFFCLFFYLVIYGKCFKPAISSYRILDDHNRARARYLEEHEKEVDRPRYILLYTSFFEEVRWGLPSATLGPDYFKAKRCPVINCVLTSDHGLVKPITEYDALVYHVASPWNVDPPSIREARQIYIAAIQESPAHTKHLLRLDTDYFNWTMTYRLDSDIVFNYRSIVDLESGEMVSPAVKPIWRYGFDAYKNASLVELVSQKRSMAVQFVSHCGAISRRDQLVRSLQSARLTVDVYGACGNHKCARNNPECEKMLDTVYWFYLSFENSLCVDYVTEKLFNALEHNIVPVVYGGADYTRFAPPGSYIDVQDYASVADLVDYLLYLVDNPQEYVKYFWWKEHYALDDFSSVWCRLCEKLHSVSTREAVQYYRDVKSWWYDDVCTVEPKLQFT
ncbi:LOW QUALITY PROTEIN: alpha-(1,3)-fucosyltransferase C [Anopheles aquasalis]|uniref:LOW QUALITY PROTEIN: alpha-(1,3)-fucosyltransferase C n=1 Tax=Anopheles aquasalis TaxID=42839 RepID=UPI00215AC70D|nr:LOW QUALITY PROTEIN: alpha-(1,3)-fucosyltransferase C [Anopheles aquasalis]